jgi:hypothetical protein
MSSRNFPVRCSRCRHGADYVKGTTKRGPKPKLDSKRSPKPSEQPQTAFMTLGELKQKLALDKLQETGIGFVSPKTYDDIAVICTPEQLVAATAWPPEICFHGIRLIKNPFIPDGEIYPFEKWD